MHFYINILTTYFPELDPPYDVYYRQILEQIELAEELGWECLDRKSTRLNSSQIQKSRMPSSA